jgi:hypothetical protein
MDSTRNGQLHQQQPMDPTYGAPMLRCPPSGGGEYNPPAPPTPGVGDPLNNLTQLMTAEPDALRTQEKKISAIIGELQKLLDSIRRPSSDQLDQVSLNWYNYSWWTPYAGPAATSWTRWV